MHMNIATVLLKAIKERQLDMFYSIEENITRQTKAAILDIIKDASKGSPEDKLRLAMIYFLSIEEVPEPDYAELESALKSAGSETGALTYVKQLKQFGRMSTSMQGGGSRSGDTLFGSFQSGLMDGAVQMLKQGVNQLKTIVATDKALLITKVVDTILENKAGSEIDSYLYFDPKSSKRTDGRALPK